MFCLQCNIFCLTQKIYIGHYTRQREDMTFIFEWWKQHFTNVRSERVKYCFYHEKIKVISSSHRVMFCLLYSRKQKMVKFHAQNSANWKWSRNRYLHQWRYGKYLTGCVFYSLVSTIIYNKWRKHVTHKRDRCLEHGRIKVMFSPRFLCVFVRRMKYNGRTIL
jgi:hypothetical protein